MSAALQASGYGVFELPGVLAVRSTGWGAIEIETVAPDFDGGHRLSRQLTHDQLVALASALVAEVACRERALRDQRPPSITLPPGTIVATEVTE